MRRAQVDISAKPVRNLLTNPSFEQGAGAFTVRTNFTQNPNFEAAGALIAVRNNLCRNPSCEVDTTGYQTNTGAGGVVVNTRETNGGVFGPGYRRSTWTTAPASGGYIEYNIINQSAFVGNTAYTFSAYIRPSMTLTIFPYVSFAQGNTTLGSSTGASVVCPANVWTRVSHTATSNVGTDGGWWDWKVASTMVDGTTIDIDAVLIEASPVLRPYFDGVTPASIRTNLAKNPSFENGGWVNNGPGTMAADATIKYVGANSLKIVPGQENWGYDNPFTSLVPGKTYTFSIYVYSVAAQNLCLTNYSSPATLGPTVAVPAGVWTRLYLTMTIPVNATNSYISVRNPDRVTWATTFYMDGYMIEESSTLGTYFDGTTTGTPGITYSWTGTANSSTSKAISSEANYGWSGAAHASTSFEQYPSVVGWNPVSGVILYRSTQESYNGTASTAFFATGPVQGGYQGFIPVPAAAGEVFTMSAYVKGPAGAQFHADFDTRTGGSAWTVTTTSAVQTFTGNWQRVSVTGAAGANADSVAFGFKTDGAITGLVYIDAILVEKTNALNDYFDGNSAQADYTYTWTGTVNASTSSMRAVRPSNVSNPATNLGCGIQSNIWSSSGSSSLRVVPISTSGDVFVEIQGMLPSGYTFQAGDTYTLAATRYQSQVLSGTPLYQGAFRGNINGQAITFNYPMGTPINAIGTTRIVATFVAPVTGTAGFLRVYSGVGVGSGEVWYDDLLFCEGAYYGDHIDGTKPSAQWDGVAHLSTSVGYPPQLLDFAGKPVLDLISPSIITVLPDNFGVTEGRTIYTVFENTQDVSTGVIDVLLYGASSLNDTPPNNVLTIRQEVAAGSNNLIKARRTGASGPLQTNGTPGMNVVCWGIDDSGYTFIQNNNSIEGIETFAMNLPHQKIQIKTSANHNHVRTIIFRGKHSLALRQAITRYLGNKYGAKVA